MEIGLHAADKNKRFEFGKNWAAFLANVGESHIVEAERSLQLMLGTQSLEGRRFLDIGSGSGLFSLAAARLQADVIHSFDFDQHSVNCTAELKRRYYPQAAYWTIEAGNVLDKEYMESLAEYDIVYSWGVLHHTGNMSRALENAIIPLKKGGCLFIAIYNDQGYISQFWRMIKRIYNFLPSNLRFLILVPVLLKNWSWKTLRDFLLLRPFHTWRMYTKQRGMSPWYDVVDWAGGYPFEVANL